jgi:hypothetical protein
MRNMSPPPRKQDNGMDRTHRAMGQRIHRDNDHERDNSGEDRIQARGDGGRFARDADDRNRPQGSHEQHPERRVDPRGLVEDRVHGQNDPIRSAGVITDRTRILPMTARVTLRRANRNWQRPDALAPIITAATRIAAVMNAAISASTTISGASNAAPRTFRKTVAKAVTTKPTGACP